MKSTMRLFILLWIWSQDTSGQPAMSSLARGYLENVIGTMERYSLHQGAIDWTKLRQDMFQRVAAAQTTIDTYPAIYFAFTKLKEHHSFLKLPDVLPEEDRKRTLASHHEILGPYTEQMQSNKTTSPFRNRLDPSGHIDTFGTKRFAHVIVPACGGKFADGSKNEPHFQEYADSLHSVVVSLSRLDPHGWIVDLRGNGGGNMWPMLAGIGAVLGEGTLGAFQSTNKVDWFYREGSAGSSQTSRASVKEPPYKFSPLPAVAVLVDRGTRSSGEAVAIAFAGREKERSFGEHTFGLSTANQSFRLSDGAVLFLNVAIDVDRIGRAYPDGVEPDVVVASPLTQIPSEDADPVIKKAEEWLSTVKQ